MPTILSKDKLINADNVSKNFIYVTDKIKYKKKVALFSLEDVKEFQNGSKLKRKDPLPEPGVYLNISDDSEQLYSDLKGKYMFLKDNFNKKLKYTLFKPLYDQSKYQKVDITDDATYYQQIENFEILLKTTLKSTIQPRLMKKGSSGTYMIFNSEDTRPKFIFKPMNEEPYSLVNQPKWLKFLQYKLLPWTFGRECLINNGNYGYITDLLVSRLDYMLFDDEGIVPWCDVCVLDSASFFAKNSVRSNVRLFVKDIITVIEQNYNQNISWIYYCLVFVKIFFMKMFKLLVFICTGTLSGEKIAVQRKLGSLQLYEREFETADDFFKKHPLPENELKGDESFNIWTEDLLNELHQQLQKLFVLDFMTRNTDRNIDNWMVCYKPGEEFGSRIRIKAIDNSLAFPFHHPNSIRTYPFEWLHHLPVYILQKRMDQEFIKKILLKLSNDSWWESFRVIFWETHSRSGKVFVVNPENSNSINYYDNPNFNLLENSKFKLNIDYKVDLQWSLFKGQAFLLYKLLKAGVSGIEVNIIDLIQMERCYVYEDPCHYFTSENNDFGTTLKNEIWQSLGLDINQAFDNSEENDSLTVDDFDHRWNLFLKGKISDDDWLNYLRSIKHHDKVKSDDESLSQENNKTVDHPECNAVSVEALTMDKRMPDKFVIASSINPDTSLISEYFYDAVSSINEQLGEESSLEAPLINHSNHYESLPIDIPLYRGDNKEMLAESLHSVLSKPYDAGSTLSGYGSCMDENQESNKLSQYEIYYIDRLEVCSDPKAFFKTW